MSKIYRKKSTTVSGCMDRGLYFIKTLLEGQLYFECILYSFYVFKFFPEWCFPTVSSVDLKVSSLSNKIYPSSVKITSTLRE